MLMTLMICKTEIRNSFSNDRFQTKGFNTPFRLDRDKNGGGIMIFVREDVLAKLLSMGESIESICSKIKLRHAKWSLSCSKNPRTELLLI